MQRLMFDLARPWLHRLDPETAHTLTVNALELGSRFGMGGRTRECDDPLLASRVFGLAFANPVGLAAGFDKDARIVDATLAMGFGFAEVGTLTPRPQDGNPRPRIFRLIEARAIINRLGFNNAGHAQALSRLQARAERPAATLAGTGDTGIVGVNIGANKDSSDRIADYVTGYETFAHLATYVTVNISSPNTPGLRDLQGLEALERLLAALAAARARRIGRGLRTPPIVVKIAPDIAAGDLGPTAELLAAAKVDAVAVSNTTLVRPAAVRGAIRNEAGGLSGRPLFNRATVALARVHQATGGRVPLIGIGGIDSGETALAKFEAGASLIQLYTGLVYEGPNLVPEIKRHLAEAVRESGASGIAALTGRRSGEWASRSLDD